MRKDRCLFLVENSNSAEIFHIIDAIYRSSVESFQSRDKAPEMTARTLQIIGWGKSKIVLVPLVMPNMEEEIFKMEVMAVTQAERRWGCCQTVIPPSVLPC